MFKRLFDSSDQTLRAHTELSDDERKLRSAKNIRFGTTIGLSLAVVIGFAVILVHAGHSTTSLAAFGASLGAGGILGFLFGVPSVPKGSITSVNANKVAIAGPGDHSTAVGTNTENVGPVAAPTNVTPITAAAHAVAPEGKPAGAMVDPGGILTLPNTDKHTSNLEQVADWVTKLLLGGGLTQMQRIPPTVWRWARLVALGIIGDDKSATEQLIVAQQAFAAGLLVYGFVLGFFSGFLITKIQLGTAIQD